MNYLNLNPKNQQCLYYLENNLINLIKLYKNNNLPNKILLSGQKGIGKATLCYHLINFLFSQNEDYKYDLKNFKINNLNKSYKLVNNNSHTNLFTIKLLKDKKNIEISQIREMINFTQKSSFNNNEKIVLIDNVESLNLNSLNALLKIIEEPNNNIIFLLVFDNNKKIASTLRSRCIKFNLHLTYKESLSTINKITNQDISKLISSELINYYYTPGDYFDLLNFSHHNDFDLLNCTLKDFIKKLIEKNDYVKNQYVQMNIFKFIELYLIKLNSDNKINNLYSDFVKKISNIKKFNLDYESLFIEFKSKILHE